MEKPEFYVYLEGTWSFHYSVWADSAEEAKLQALEDIRADHGPLDLAFEGVKVFDKDETQLLVAWTGWELG